MEAVLPGAQHREAGEAGVCGMRGREKARDREGQGQERPQDKSGGQNT